MNPEKLITPNKTVVELYTLAQLSIHNQPLFKESSSRSLPTIDLLHYVTSVDDKFSTKHLYNVFRHWPTIEKKARLIQAPKPETKAIQEDVLKYFQANTSIHSSATGIDEKDYIYNALQHKDKKSIFCLDIRSFYTSCRPQGNLLKALKKDDIYTFIDQIAFCLFYTDTKKSSVYLPTGAPTSPYLSALMMKEFDTRIQDLADRYNLTYTRYFDDITLSSDEELTHDQKRGIKRAVIDFVHYYGFTINKTKTKWLNPHEDKMVITGVDIRNLPKVNSQYIHKHIRPILNRAASIALNGQVSAIHTLDDFEKLISSCSFNDILIELNSTELGKVNYVKQVNLEQYKKLETYALKRFRVNLVHTMICRGSPPEIFNESFIRGSDT